VPKAGTKVAIDELCKRATAAKALQARGPIRGFAVSQPLVAAWFL